MHLHYLSIPLDSCKVSYKVDGVLLVPAGIVTVVRTTNFYKGKRHVVLIGLRRYFVWAPFTALERGQASMLPLPGPCFNVELVKVNHTR